MEESLYTFEGKKIVKDDFLDALDKIGVKKGDTLFVHSDTRVFGKLALASKELFLRALVEVLEESVGKEGTVIMPTFSYSFCNEQTFDKRETPSTVGVLTDFFRKEVGVERSLHPLFSVAVWGKKQKEYLRTSKDSFGEGTVFETLHTDNGKILLFGTDFQACTFLHYVEQALNVPYRYMKDFRGTIVDGSKSYEDEYSYFVRPLDGTIENDFRVIEPLLRDEKILKEATVGGGKLLLVSAKELFEVAKHAIQKDPYFFVQGQ